MSWRSMNRKCDSCGHTDSYLAHSSEQKADWECTSQVRCEGINSIGNDFPGTMVEIFACPAILTSESASFLDGTVRPGFAAARDSLREKALRGKNHGRG